MGAPKGNKYKAGKKHPGRGGRPSAYQEKADAEWLADFFFKERTQDELTEMLKDGRTSVAKLMLQKALLGNEKFTLAVFHRLFPEKMDIKQSTTLSLADLFDKAKEIG